MLSTCRFVILANAVILVPLSESSREVRSKIVSVLYITVPHDAFNRFKDRQFYSADSIYPQKKRILIPCHWPGNLKQAVL